MTDNETYKFTCTRDTPEYNRLKYTPEFYRSKNFNSSDSPTKQELETTYINTPLTKPVTKPVPKYDLSKISNFVGNVRPNKNSTIYPTNTKSTGGKKTIKNKLKNKSLRQKKRKSLCKKRIVKK
jgi:hypothetical protein